MPTEIPSGLSISFTPITRYHVSHRTMNNGKGQYRREYLYHLRGEHGIVNNSIVQTSYDIYNRYTIEDSEQNEIPYIEWNDWKLTYKISQEGGRVRKYLHYTILNPLGNVVFESVKTEPFGYYLHLMLCTLFKYVDGEEVEITPSSQSVHKQSKTSELRQQIQDKYEELLTLQTELKQLNGSYVLPDETGFYVEDESYNESLRIRSEEFLYKYLTQVCPSERVIWMNKNGEQSTPYDFVILDSSNEIESYIDCKSTPYGKKTFYMTGNEWSFFLRNKDMYKIFRVFNVESDMTVYEINNLYDAITNDEVVPYSNRDESQPANRVLLTIK